MWGRDPVRMLNGLITNDLALLSESRAVYAALLTPKGRVISDVRASEWFADGGREVMAEIPTAALDTVGEHLRKFVPPLFARWEDASGGVATLGVYGPRARGMVRAVLAAVPPEDEDAAVRGRFEDVDVTAVCSRAAGGPGYDLIVERPHLSRLVEALLAEGGEGARTADLGTLETLRIEAGRPRFGAELTAETLPGEAYEAIGMLPRTISFTKGCYTGQEVVIRIAHRGHVNRHLRGLSLASSDPPPHRTPLFDPGSGKVVGWTTSATRSPRRGETIALAYVRREIGPGGEVRVGSGDGALAEVRELPFL